MKLLGAASHFICILLLMRAVYGVDYAPQQAQSSIETFRTCINRAFTFQPTNWDDSIQHDTLPRLYLEKAWQTSKRLLGPLTLVTHTSFNRLYQLRAQCKSWGGPLVVAVHLPVVQADGLHALTHENALTVQAATSQLDRFFGRMEAMPRCQLHMFLLWEVYRDHEASILYPYNMLRNYALLQARTELITMIDVDLLPSQNFFPELLSPRGQLDNRNMTTNLTAVVLPAFETIPGPYSFVGEMAIANRAIHGGKATIATLVAQGLVRPFHQERYALGHNCTDYPRWYIDSKPYHIIPTTSYEPWFMLDRTVAPWYDVRYRGYFYDKIVYVSSLMALGFEYVAHPRAYIMHRPHNLTSALQSPLLPKLQEVMFLKYTTDVARMQSKQYRPALDSAFLQCASLVPWARGYP